MYFFFIDALNGVKNAPFCLLFTSLLDLYFLTIMSTESFMLD